MSRPLSRRQMITRSSVCLGAGVAVAAMPAAAAESEKDPKGEPFRYCLNTGTIMGCNLPLDREVDVAAKAGYDGIEPWIGKIDKFVAGGGSLKDIKKRLDDAGLVVESAIGFPRWAVDDEQKRAEGLESMRKAMGAVSQMGGRRIAAPPAGINRTEGMDLRKVAERYRAVLELGGKMGVVAQLEIWGSAKTLGTVAEAAFVAIAANRPDACLLLDAYHMYKGGSDFNELKLLNGAAMHCFHINDYPADPPRETISDADRVYPGDGIAPLDTILRDLYTTGFRGALSLELFNRTYWKQDALTVAKTGLEKTKAVVQKALAK